MRLPYGPEDGRIRFMRMRRRHTPFLHPRKCCPVLQKKTLIEGSPPSAATLIRARTETEFAMAESRQGGPQTAKRSERPIEDNRSDTSDGGNEAGGQAAQRQAERLAELGQQGVRKAADASAAATSAAQRSGSAVADCAQEITAAWARYAEEVMRHTSEASRALLRARTFNEMLEVQAKLLRDNMQAFLDQSVRVAESASLWGRAPWRN